MLSASPDEEVNSVRGTNGLPPVTSYTVSTLRERYPSRSSVVDRLWTVLFVSLMLPASRRNLPIPAAFIARSVGPRPVLNASRRPRTSPKHLPCQTEHLHIVNDSTKEEYALARSSPPRQRYPFSHPTGYAIWGATYAFCRSAYRGNVRWCRSAGTWGVLWGVCVGAPFRRVVLQRRACTQLRPAGGWCLVSCRALGQQRKAPDAGATGCVARCRLRKGSLQ